MNSRIAHCLQSSDFITPIENASIASDTLHTVIREILSAGQPISITVTGTSMQSFLRHGLDRVFLEPCDPAKIARGDIVMYCRDSGQWVLHRVYRVADGVLTMIGDAQWLLEEGIRQDQIIGKATHALRRGKVISCERGLRHQLMKCYLYRMKAPRFFQAVGRGKTGLKTVVKRALCYDTRRNAN